MSLCDDRDFRKYLENVSNVYKTVCTVAAKSRELSDKYDNKLLTSEAITHAVHRTEPDPEHLDRYQIAFEEYYLRETFCYIDDKELCQAVRKSFYTSKQ